MSNTDGAPRGSRSADANANANAPASLHLASTPMIALSCAAAARAQGGRARLLLLGDFPDAPRLADLLRRWRGNPFERIDILPGRFDEHARGAPDRERGLAQFFRRIAIKRRLRRETLARIQAHDQELAPTRVWLGNDRKVETQYALMLAAQRSGPTPGEYLDDGLYTYLGDVRQRPLTRWVDALVKRFVYGHWWRSAAHVGTTHWIERVWLALPAQAPPDYAATRVRQLPREWFTARTWLRLALLAVRDFAIDRRALHDCAEVWILPHSNLLRAAPELCAQLRARLGTLQTRAAIPARIAIKYHPRDVEHDPADLLSGLRGQSTPVLVLPASVPMELLLPLLRAGTRIEGEASTALLAARWLRPDLDIHLFGLANHPYAQAARSLFDFAFPTNALRD